MDFMPGCAIAVVARRIPAAQSRLNELREEAIKLVPIFERLRC
jgi:hypothetical protein